MRRMVPTIRNLLNREDIEEDKKKDDLELLIKYAANPRVHYAEFDDKLAEYNGRIAKAPEIIQGAKYIVPGGDTVFYIRVKGMEQERTVELALKNRAELPLTDLTRLIEEVLMMLKAGRLEVEKDNQFMPKLLKIFEGAQYGRTNTSTITLPVD
jgi:hypothetical protein